ncbi:hypothetical protein HJC23_013522 [Cyclotella cryptica]|uniref:Uncharacterized protein n=1 Tax=Cyclotella cryptica TaxID=29204 RepID=A0ABD3NW70_9STRA|eukprot:CCRYP_019213-RA/>CCRYP_019213-RA protein AED:0.32 eAED:0.43 QI:0/-1/0/1/-1/1/1/0/73
MEKMQGIVKLRRATGPPPSSSNSGPPTFKPVPIFAFAMIDEDKFGNGIGWDADGILLCCWGNIPLMREGDKWG